MAAVLAVALAAVVLPARGADALELGSLDSRRVLGDLSHERLEVRYADGERARVDVLRFPEGGETVELRPRLADGTAAGLQTMTSMSLLELSRGAVAGTNGGYWLGRPSGAPNGLHVEADRMFAADSVNRWGNPVGRGVLGIQQDDELVFDRLGVTLTLDLVDVPGREPAVIDELNRQVRTATDGTGPVDGELLLFDQGYGASFEVPGGSVLLVVEDLRLATSGQAEGDVVDVRTPTYDTSFRVPEGRSVLLAYGERAPALEGVAVGSRLGVTTVVAPYVTAASEWEELRGAIAGGPLLIRDGERLSVDEWRTEAFSEPHLTGRQPRTAIARTADGEVLMVTVDGRLPGWSVGASLRELAEMLLELGAVDAVNLDGGGSTTMTINGEIRNRPSEPERSVANGLFLYAPLPPAARGLALACPAAAPRAGFEDTPGTIHEASIDCLAWWGVTTGVTPTSFAPNRPVSREQMASFLARWIDDIAARGDGEPLPASAPLRFDDVTPGTAHADAIARLSSVGVIDGRTEETFAPQAPVSRAQTASLLRAALEFVTGSALPDADDTFVDDTGSVHEASIDTLASVGVITGTGGFSFAPQAPVTRAAMSALVMRATDLLVEEGQVPVPA